MGRFLRHFLEWYTGIATLAFLFMVLGMNLKAPESFFKSLLWPVVACEHVDTCNKKLINDSR